jgi:hypothetical protein
MLLDAERQKDDRHRLPVNSTSTSSTPPLVAWRTMVGFVSRGNGYLSPLLLTLSFVLMIPAHDIGLGTCQTAMVVWLLATGTWVLWYGLRALRRAPEELGRPLRPIEWVLDLALGSRPFHSFMAIQLPWWAIAHLVMAGWVIQIMRTAKG